MSEISNSLSFVKGAVARKDFVPVLRHVFITNKRIQAFNGQLALSAPVDIDETITPVAVDFIRAIEQCEDPKMHITKGGKLSIKDGSFKAFVKLTDETSFPEVTPEGEIINVNENFTDCFKALAPFIGDDASRPWSAGVIIKGGYAYATNNVVLACYTKPIGTDKEFIIPEAAVKELARIKEVVISIQVSNNAVTFHFEGDKWLRTSLLANEAPDFSPIFKKCSFNIAEMNLVQEDLFARLERLKHFMDKKNPTIIFKRDGIFTSQYEEGAIDSEYSFPLAAFRFEPLLGVVEKATHWDLSYYPAPCSFVGENISGVIVGIKVDAS